MTALEVLLLLLLAATALFAGWLRRQLVETRTGQAREIAEQREKHEAAQQAQSARIDTMLDGMVEGLLVVDTQNHIVLANRAAEKIFSFSRMMAGGTLLQAVRHHEVAALAARAATQSTAIEHEISIDVPEPKVLQVSAVALRDPSGGAQGAVLVFHDVTRLRELEAMRQDFVANVSHELRTPLSLIKSAAETLIDGGKNDPVIATRFLDIIDKHANRLTLLIDDLLLLARLDSGRIELSTQPVALRLAGQEALDDAALIARTRNVTLENRIPSGLTANADPDRLRQVFANLIDNAIKYGRTDGRVTLNGRACEGGRVEFSVRDDGPGIPGDALERVFERFYRVDKARSREAGGTGLGLAIVKNVVQAHHGDVRVESHAGEGAEFFIMLPAAAKAA